MIVFATQNFSGDHTYHNNFASGFLNSKKKLFPYKTTNMLPPPPPQRGQGGNTVVYYYTVNYRRSTINCIIN
jgi:hypothetical protein